jgi:hypothetical protein
MLVFAIRIKHPFAVAVQCPHGADARYHGGPVELNDQEHSLRQWGVPFASPNALFNLSKLSVWWLRLGIAIERIKPVRKSRSAGADRLDA